VVSFLLSDTTFDFTPRNELIERGPSMKEARRMRAEYFKQKSKRILAEYYSRQSKPIWRIYYGSFKFKFIFIAFSLLFISSHVHNAMFVLISSILFFVAILISIIEIPVDIIIGLREAMLSTNKAKRTLKVIQDLLSLIFILILIYIFFH
jgi:succinate dehydrogenase hydrophobic anchor subunit